MDMIEKTKRPGQRLAEDTDGPSLTAKMLTDTPLLEAWLVNYVANFFVGPVYKRLSEEFGLTRPEFVVLFCLSQQADIASKDIVQATGLPKNSISRAVSDLLRKEMIETRVRTGDKRSKTLIITGAGTGMLDAVLPIVTGKQATMLSMLSDNEQDQFRAILSKLAHSVPDWA